MTHLAELVPASAGDLIWVVIVVIAIISQLVKAGKKAQKEARPPSPMPQSPSEAPEDELRRFLESLTGIPSEAPPSRPPVSPPPVAQPSHRAPATVPPPIPVRVKPPRAPVVIKRVRYDDMLTAQRQARDARVAQRSTPPPPRLVKKTVELKPPQPAPMPVSPAPVVATAAPVPQRDEPLRTQRPERTVLTIRRLRLALGGDLTSRASLQKAILLQEVLNQPIALRRPNQAGAGSAR
jgi:hypothetical protein